MNLEENPGTAARLCIEAERRLWDAVQNLSEKEMSAESSLPDWTRATVLTHLARNADAHCRRIQGALEGRDVPKYEGGAQQRAREIEEGQYRPSEEILADLETSQEALVSVMQEADQKGWPNSDFRAGGAYGVGASPAHRLREVEMHHVDLGIGYSPQEWSDGYVEWEIATLLPSIDKRLRQPGHRASFLAWMAGRGDSKPGWQLEPWG